MAKRSDPSKTKKLCIVGSADSTLDDTPWGDRSYDIWALAWAKVPRASVCFDLHRFTDDRKAIRGDYFGWLKGLNVPVYMQKESIEKFGIKKHVPKVVPFPEEDVRNFIWKLSNSEKDRNYFGSSIAWMLGFGMYCGYSHILMTGVDMSADTEYFTQRPNLEYLIGLARGRGYTVEIPEDSALLKIPTTYAYGNDQWEGPLTEEVLLDRLNQYKEKQEKHKTSYLTLDGAIQEVNQLLDIIRLHKRGRGLKKND